jgi:16S rRNA (guanine966-N2)-methyltransferase
MRIISGKFKGKIIVYLKNLITRPLKDSIKENIFNILTHSNLIHTTIEGANILDVYSGVGSFGLECISRGAKKVTFVEQDKKALLVLEQNLAKLSIGSQAQIIKDKIENMLLKNEKKKYDIFFFDPPFADDKFIQNFKLIKKNKIYQNNHIVVIHREINSNDKFDDYINTIEIKKYGRSKIIFGHFN